MTPILDRESIEFAKRLALFREEIKELRNKLELMLVISMIEEKQNVKTDS